MDTNALKKFAQSARNLLIDQVRAKLDLVLASGSAARREHPAAMDELDKAVFLYGKDQVIEQVAYTWFNRFSALRFMDANGYTSTGIVSPAAGQTRPEILAEAMAGNIPDGAPAAVAGILDGTVPSSDPQAEAYRLLLVHACNQWHEPMPFLFEKLDDFSELLMPEDLLSQASILAEMRKVMTDDACQDVEIIGWLYQFYISEKKDQVFAGLKKNQKITAENIPAATQLFTPHWIVRYLVENSLGRLWLLNRPSSKLAAQMDYYIAPEEPETDFLRISKPEEIQICDPACGSGHMLTYAFDLLYAIYEEEGYEVTEIPGLILTHNLHGIEIDDRAGALAAFALSMKAAAKLGRRRFLKLEAKPNICVLQNVHFTAAEMQDVLAVVGSDLFTNDFRETMGQFEEAKNFGSLIVPKLRDPAEVARLVKLKDFSRDLLLREVQARVLQVLEMAEALAPKYHVVVANPPYMGSGGMNEQLNRFAKSKYPDSKTDLYSMFMETALNLTCPSGFMAMINMQSWMFLSGFQQLRQKFLTHATLSSMAHLGERGFDTIGGAVVSTAAFVFEKSVRPEYNGTYFRLIAGRSESEKSQMFITANSTEISNIKYKNNAISYAKIPGYPIAYWLTNSAIEIFSDSQKLSDVVTLKSGMSTTNNDRFLRQWFEVSLNHFKSKIEGEIYGPRWFPYVKGGSYRKWYGNRDYVVNWEDNGAELKSFVENNPRDPKTKHWSRRIFNSEYFFRPMLAWSRISSGPLSVRRYDGGMIFSDASNGGFGDNDKLNIVTCMLNSKPARILLEALSPTLNYYSGDMERLPIKLQSIPAIDNIIINLINISKKDWDSQECSWDFSTHYFIRDSSSQSAISEIYERIREFWRGMTNDMQLLEEENNRLFIEAYGLQDELTADVSLDEISLTCNPAYRYGLRGAEAEREQRLRADTMAEFLSYAVGCMFGRYSLDEPGLILANQGETLADYLARVPAPTFMPDEDNVIPVLDGDWFADDVTERFRLFLRVTFGDEHFQANLKFIEDSLGKDIRRYFIKDFYADHLKRYKKRPIYWMFSSPKGTFNALIYMHRYRPDTVSILLNDYLREFISKLEGERGRLEKLSDDPSASQSQRTKALKDMGVVAKQIDELNEWERDVIFPLAQAKIEIDLDDGVKANYPKFGTALKRIPGLEEKDD